MNEYGNNWIEEKIAEINEQAVCIRKWINKRINEKIERCINWLLIDE